MKYLIIFILFIISFNLYSSYPEFFGSSPTNSSIANQANSNPQDPGNNYYLPALLAFSDSVDFSLNAAMVNTNFKDINNITTENSINGTSEDTGSAITDYQTFNSTNLHINLPIGHKKIGNITFSMFAPIGSIAETNSGDPFLPEYVMYRARYRRMMMYFNYAHKVNNNWAVSLGANLSYQTGADVYTQTSLNGTDYGSSASMKAKIKPSLAAIISLAYRKENSLAYFTFHQEMKTNLESGAGGEINRPTPGLYDITIKSMAYYDPYILRFGFNFKKEKWEFLNSLEYQMWHNYQTPVVRIVDNGGIINPSADYEQVEVNNIFVPKTALRYSFTDRFSVGAGYSFRPTPLEGDFSGSGNSIDTNSHILTTGYEWDVTVKDYTFTLTGNGQFHKLTEKSVTKSSNQEDGDAGDKIGSPGYQIGGSVLVFGLGLKTSF